MLLPHPTRVTFGDLALDAVASVAVDRLAAREIVEFSDLGPHAAFADVPELRTHISLVRRPDRPDSALPLPGDQADLSFTVATGAHDARRTRFRARCVLREIRHDTAAARQTLAFIALSTDGAADPLTREPV